MSRRLIGWKAIGQFLGCTERTARRWEAHRALPVYRIPGGGRRSVWASAEELGAWLRALPDDVQDTLAEGAPQSADECETAASLAPCAPALTPGEPPTAADQYLTVPPAPAAGDTHAAALPAAAAARPQNAPAHSARRRLLWGFLAAAVAGLLFGIPAWLTGPRHFMPQAQRSGDLGRTPYDDNAEARATYLDARFALATRSADSLSSASRDFGQLVQRFPERAAGWSGLAETFLMLREFGSLPDRVAYPQAARAAGTAIALDSRQSTAWLDQAFVTWWWQGDSTKAFQQFATALQLDPTSARAHHWFATALAAHGDSARALVEISRARALSPDNRAIVADEAFVQYGAGKQREVATATLERLTRTDPQFESPHFYLSRIYLLEQRDADFLREAKVAAQLRGQNDVLEDLRLAEQRLHSAGRQAMLEQLAQSETERWQRGLGSAVFVAQYRALAQDRAGMLRWLAIAEAYHDHYLQVLRGQPEFAALRSDPAFIAVANRTP